LFESSIVDQVAAEEGAKLIERGNTLLLRVLGLEIVPELFGCSICNDLCGVTQIGDRAQLESDCLDHSLFDETECGFLVAFLMAVAVWSTGLLLPVNALQNFPICAAALISIAQSE